MGSVKKSNTVLSACKLFMRLKTTFSYNPEAEDYRKYTPIKTRDSGCHMEKKGAQEMKLQYTGWDLQKVAKQGNQDVIYFFEQIGNLGWHSIDPQPISSRCFTRYFWLQQLFCPAQSYLYSFDRFSSLITDQCN